MKFRVIAAGLLLAAGQTLLTGCAEQPEMLNAKQLSAVKHIAVLPFEDGPGLSGPNSGTAVSGFVTGELAKAKRFRLFERSRLKSILDEQDLRLSGAVDQETAVKLGKLLGADAVIVGSVSQYDMDKTQVYVHMIPIVSKEYTVGAALRMLDVGSGEVIYAHSASGKSSNSFTDAGKQAAQRLLAPLPR